MTRREKFVEILKKHGYTSMNNFCIENKLSQSNFNNRIKNEDIKVELPILFQLANILHEPIMTMIEIFYPDEVAENKSNVEN